jgi:aspartokinase/homoserine dehydrogenase 1
VDRRHLGIAEAVAPSEDASTVSRRLTGLLQELRDVARGVRLLRECSARSLDHLYSFGELLSATVVAAALRGRKLPARMEDARRLVVTDDRHGRARVDPGSTRRKIRRRLIPAAAETRLVVVPGFVAATPDGKTTTLGRGGSDYTATLLGAALDAERVEIWTDVDGIMTADPRAVPDAEALPEVTYEELLELSSLGARVVHPPAVHPVKDSGIPLVIRNSVRSDLPGTRVTGDDFHDRPGPVRSISAVSDVALLRLEDIERVGAMEVAERVLRALRREGVDLLLFTRDCSGHSLSFAIAPRDLEKTEEALAYEFEWERKRRLLGPPAVERGRSIVAAVGEGMRKTPGVAGRFFSVLGDADVNVHAIAQGSSERNISCVVDGADRDRALRAVHRAFFPGPNRSGAPGTGVSGSSPGGPAHSASSDQAEPAGESLR